MNKEEWRTRLDELQEVQSARDVTSEAALRLSLAELWNLLRTCPNDIVTIYRQASEASILAYADPLREVITHGRLKWDLSGSETQVAMAIGGQLRAIDAALADRPGFAQPPAGPNSYLCAESDAFVVPRRLAKSIDAHTGPGRGFGRRGTPHHRVLPRRIGDFEVKIVWSPQLSAGAVGTNERALGAALFPGMRLVQDTALEPQWIALSADCPDEQTMIPLQVNNCYESAALALVYPELSMPETRRLLLSEALRDRSAQMELGQGPALVAAGSWHERGADGVRNVMRILDKSGVERMQYAKTSAFFRDGVREGIVTSDIVPVLVNTDFLATFAICLDFCERDSNPLQFARR